MRSKGQGAKDNPDKKNNTMEEEKSVSITKNPKEKKVPGGIFSLIGKRVSSWQGVSLFLYSWRGLMGLPKKKIEKGER